MKLRLPAEWEEQDGVLLAWPHQDSDWCESLPVVEPVFLNIILEISRFEKVLLVVPKTEPVREKLKCAGASLEQISFIEMPTNDTWARDFGPITVFEDERPVLLDFGFNGWGLKFASNFDNQVTVNLARAGCFGKCEVRIPGMILEGGSLESDGAGTLLVTSQCLLEANRNPHLSREEIEAHLCRLLGAHRVLWLEKGYLAGDDTDSHVDTLARLCPDDVIAYVRCDDPSDEHNEALSEMEAQLCSFRTAAGQPYKLLALPWPKACFDETGQRLPATYANFLIINNAVLVPTYRDKQDAVALKAISKAFPNRQIIGIDCLPLIAQHGSLHCVTMQLPKGVWV